jgi:hypothetical protein
MSVALTSTKPKITNRAEVESILFEYQLTGINVLIDADNQLEIALDAEWPSRPGAVSNDDLPDFDEPDGDKYFNALLAVPPEKGDDGFIEVLSKLSPFIASPLFILTVEVDDYREGWAYAWRVQPGSAEVEVLSV